VSEQRGPITDESNGATGAGAGDSSANANDNGIPERMVVMIPKGRPEHMYARFGNLLLPLRFAQRMEGWTRPDTRRPPRRAPPRTKSGDRPRKR
jgi:hypothetical protein